MQRGGVNVTKNYPGICIVVGLHLYCEILQATNFEVYIYSSVISSTFEVNCFICLSAKIGLKNSRISGKSKKYLPWEK